MNQAALNSPLTSPHRPFPTERHTVALQCAVRCG
jgi:hypothetical protein